MNQLSLLFAANNWDALLQLGAIILFFVAPLVIKAIGSLGGGNKNQQQQQQPRPQARPGGAGQNKPLQTEVEEFLARAKGQPRQQAKPQGPVRQPGPVKARPIRPPQPKSLAGDVIEAEVLDAPRHGSLFEHVDRHMAPRPDPASDSPIESNLSQADENLESHLRETFSNDLSKFRSDDNQMVAISQGTDADVWKTFDPDAPVAPAGPSLAGEIAAMFRDPHSVRKAVVLTEIINPPEHRWE